MIVGNFQGKILNFQFLVNGKHFKCYQGCVKQNQQRIQGTHNNTRYGEAFSFSASFIDLFQSNDWNNQTW